MLSVHSSFLDGEDAEDLRDERIWVLAMVLDIAWENLQHCFYFFGLHRLDHKFAVMAQEEEAPTLSSSFASVESLLSIENWIQTLVEEAHAEIVLLK